jgi:hypothetical protein
MAVKIIDNMKGFIQKNTTAMDRALNRMVVDIERLSKEQVPFLKGQLKSSGYHKKKGLLNWIVAYNKVYALYQHEGGDGKRVVRKYSYPGKKKHYLKDPGDLISKKAVDYFRQEAGRL